MISIIHGLLNKAAIVQTLVQQAIKRQLTKKGPSKMSFIFTVYD